VLENIELKIDGRTKKPIINSFIGIFGGSCLLVKCLKKTVNQAKKAVDTWLTLCFSVIDTFKTNNDDRLLTKKSLSFIKIAATVAD